MKNKGFLSNLSTDLPGGVVVFFVALPLCLGIALASEAPIISGLIAGIIGGLIVGFLSGSQVGVSGPAAGLAVVVMNSIVELGSFEAFLCAVIIAGFLQILFGYLRAGIIAYYFPSSVITGMLSGIGILIILKQIPHALGFDRNPEGQLAFTQPDGVNTFTEVGSAINRISNGPVIIALVSLFLLILWEQPLIKNSKISKIPGAVVAIFTAAILAYLFKGYSNLALSKTQLVSIPAMSSISDMKKFISFPDFSILMTNYTVYKIAVLIAVVASIETLLCVEATDKLDPQKRITPTNRELKAQGVGNIISGLIGGLPITQVIVRSSANVQAGSQSQLAAIIHGALLIICTLFFYNFINFIPLASLASILFVVGYKLARPVIFKKMWNQGLSHFIPFCVTILGIIFTDLLSGVAAGLVVGIIAILYENYTLPFAIMHYERHGKRNVKIKLAQQMTFLHKASLLSTLKNIPEDLTIHIDATHSSYIHPDIEEIIHDFIESSHNKNQKVFYHVLPKDERKKSYQKKLHHDHRTEMTKARELQTSP